MKVLRLLLMALFVASLPALMSGPVQATDHPWDDSTVDSSQVAGSGDSNTGKPTIAEIAKPVYIEIRNFVLRFLSDAFSWDVRKVDDGAGEGSGNKRVKVNAVRTFVNVRAELI
jgi:hypothetical protein